MDINSFLKKIFKSDSKDPVCGMSVDMENTKYLSDCQGETYGFCSENCKKTFDQNPGQYAQKSPAAHT